MMQYSDDDYSEYNSEYNSEYKYKKKVVTPAPVQLAPKHCNCAKCEWHGQEKPCEQKYITMSDMRLYYEKQARFIASGVKAEALQAISKIQAFYLAVLNEKDEKAKQLILEHQEIVNTLAKEASAAQERRNKEKVYKKKFGVRNTGSFKKKANKLLKKKTEVPLEKKEVFSSEEDVKTTLQVYEECDSAWTEVKKTNVEQTNVEQTNVEQINVEQINVEQINVEQINVEQINVEQINVEQINVEQINVEHKNSRTRMCNSVSTGEVCKHGENCRFAHKWDELVVLDCHFGSDCKYVQKQTEGVYTVVKGKYCNYKHPKETKESICVRLGMPPKVNSSEIIDLNPKLPRSIMKEHVKSVSFDTVKEITQETEEEEVVIRVQKELAVQALEILVKSGKNKIKVEFI
jgi:hypothetical protein